MPLTKGTTLLNRYRIDNLLGAGGMGAVYYAWDTRLNRGVALKENTLATVTSNEQFEREAQTLARLRHNHLPAVHDYFILPNSAQYLVMEYIEGEDLAQIVKRHGPLPESEVLAWTEQICAALTYLHSQQPPIIHRDIKPQNLKLTPQGEIFLVDLGLAKVGEAQAKTVTGAQGGTPGYSPLEQYGIGGTDPRSDVYALGATLYTLLTGQVPPESIARAMEMQSLVPMRQVRPDITPIVAQAIETALHVRPTQRPQSVAAFQALLRPPVQEAKREPAARAIVTQQRASGVEPPVSAVRSAASGIARLPFGPEMILIPAGEFLMGSDPQKDKDAFDLEPPQHKLYLPDYYIAKTPITNAQYATFVEATGYDAPEHWENGNIPRGLLKNHPVVDVTWYDAMAYCKWLAEATGKPYTLPSEAEWEKAARGTDGRTYPWGNTFDKSKCNVKESGIGDTTPVDKYPQGASPYGVWDMAGNVWEWTRSQCEGYPYDPADGREDVSVSARRVVRGGAFTNNEWIAHSAIRSYLDPVGYVSNNGFRVAIAAFQALLRPSVQEAKREPAARAAVTQQRASGVEHPASAVWSAASGIARLPFEPEMILISAGEFLMGSDPQKDKDADENEQPQHRLYLPDYYIAKTPVTNEQYAAFVQAMARKVPQHWQNGKIPQGKATHPVMEVTWYDAMAYCKWLAEATGKPYTLPSEAEWEKAARGTDGRLYPWGNTFDKSKCNVKKFGIGDTTPVDKYPQGASPYGVWDMAGNVWEWTRSLWGKDWRELDFKYPYQVDDGRENLEAGDGILRVLRGGSFGDDWFYAHCACRFRSSPGYRGPNFGVRVVVSPSRA